MFARKWHIAMEIKVWLPRIAEKQKSLSRLTGNNIIIGLLLSNV